MPGDYSEDELNTKYFPVLIISFPSSRHKASHEQDSSSLRKQNIDGSRELYRLHQVSHPRPVNLGENTIQRMILNSRKAFIQRMPLIFF